MNQYNANIKDTIKIGIKLSSKLEKTFQRTNCTYDCIISLPWIQFFQPMINPLTVVIWVSPNDWVSMMKLSKDS